MPSKQNIVPDHAWSSNTSPPGASLDMVSSLASNKRTGIHRMAAFFTNSLIHMLLPFPTLAESMRFPFRHASTTVSSNACGEILQIAEVNLSEISEVSLITDFAFMTCHVLGMTHTSPFFLTNGSTDLFCFLRAFQYWQALSYNPSVSLLWNDFENIQAETDGPSSVSPKYLMTNSR